MNSTPCELQKPLAFGRYAPILCLWHKAHGATLLASLMSELIDSASLRYLRRRSLCELRRWSDKSRFRRKKYGIPEKVFRIFGGEREI